MGADAFIAFYGIRIDVDPTDDAAVDAVDEGTHPVCVAAAALGLERYTGRSTEGVDYFLYVGRRVADVGGESARRVAVDPAALDALTGEVDAALRALGRPERPGLHLQVDAQY